MRILIAQTSFLGDVVLSTPVIGALKALYPSSEIWMMTTHMAKELVLRDPILAGVITFDKRGSEAGPLGLWRKARELKKYGFDSVYSLHRSPRTSMLLYLSGIRERIGFSNAKLSWLYTEVKERTQSLHDVERNLQIIGREIPPELKELRLFEPSEFEVSEQVRCLEKRGDWVILVPGSVWATKRWHWEHYRSVLKDLLSKKAKVLLLGSPEERALCEQICSGTEAINLAGRISLGEMIWVVKHSKLMICNDSMALHMASALKVPSIAIFCATSPTFGFGPWRNISKVIEHKGLTCKPCSRHGTKACPVKTEACMRELLPNSVISAIESLESRDAA